MLPNNLLQLACQEFASPLDAMNAAPYRLGDTIYYRNKEWRVWQVPSSQKQELRLTELLSGKWAWVPLDIEDQALVQISKATCKAELSRLKQTVFRIQEIANEDSFTPQALGITPLCQRMLEEISRLEGFENASSSTEQR